MKKSLVLFVMCAVAAFIFAVPARSAATEAVDLVPKNASAIMVFDSARGGLFEKTVDFFNKIDDKEAKKATETMREKFGFAFDGTQFLSSIASVTFIYFDEYISASTDEVPLAMVIKMAKKESFMVNLSNLKATLSKENGKYKLYSVKDSKPEIEIIEGSENKSDYFAFTVDGDFLIAATGRKSSINIVNKIVDSAKQGLPALSSDEKYVEAIKTFKSAPDAYLYISGDYIRKSSKELDTARENLDFLNSFCAAFSVNGSRLELTAYLITDRTKKENAFLKYFTRNGGELTSTKLLDPETFMYIGSRLNMDIKQLKNAKEYAMIKEQINTDLGIDFETDVLSWFADEFFVSVNNYKVLNIPVMLAPKMYLGFKSKDKAACLKCMDKIMTALKINALSFTETKSGDTSIYHCPTPVPGNVMPELGITWAYFNDYLIVTTSKDSLNALMALSGKKDGKLSDNKTFTGAVGPLAASSLFTAFYNGDAGYDFLSSLSKYGDSKIPDSDLEVLKILKNMAAGVNFMDGNMIFHVTADFDTAILLKALNSGK